MDHTLNGATIIQNGDKIVVFANDDLHEEEARHLQDVLMEHLPLAEVIVVVGVSGVVVGRAEAGEEAR